MLLAITVAAQLVTAQAELKPSKLHLVPPWVPYVAAFDTQVLVVSVTSIVAFTVFPQPRCGCVWWRWGAGWRSPWLPSSRRW